MIDSQLENLSGGGIGRVRWYERRRHDPRQGGPRQSGRGGDPPDLLVVGEVHGRWTLTIPAPRRPPAACGGGSRHRILLREQQRRRRGGRFFRRDNELHLPGEQHDDRDGRHESIGFVEQSGGGRRQRRAIGEQSLRQRGQHRGRDDGRRPSHARKLGQEPDPPCKAGLLVLRLPLRRLARPGRPPLYPLPPLSPLPPPLPPPGTNQILSRAAPLGLEREW